MQQVAYRALPTHRSQGMLVSVSHSLQHPAISISQYCAYNICLSGKEH